MLPYLLLLLSWTGQQFLLPKLAKLECSVNWEHSMHQLCHFILPALRDLVIYLEKSFPAGRAVRTLHSLISLPSLRLTTLSISTNYPDVHSDMQVASAVASFVKAQSTLVNLGFPSLWSRGQFMDGLTQHANLLVLELLLRFDTPSETWVLPGTGWPPMPSCADFYLHPPHSLPAPYTSSRHRTSASMPDASTTPNLSPKGAFCQR